MSRGPVFWCIWDGFRALVCWSTRLVLGAATRPDGPGRRGRPDSLGLILALKERLMYPLSSPAIKLCIALLVRLLPCLGLMPVVLKTGIALLADLQHLDEVDLWGWSEIGI